MASAYVCFCVHVCAHMVCTDLTRRRVFVQCKCAVRVWFVCGLFRVWCVCVVGGWVGVLSLRCVEGWCWFRADLVLCVVCCCMVVGGVRGVAWMRELRLRA
jgi:hypothetical protein